MRITFVLGHAGLSGGVRVVGEYAQRLSERGHEVTIVSREWHPPGRRRRAWRRLQRAVGRLVPGMPSGEHPSHLDGIELEHRVFASDHRLTSDDVPDADVVVATWWETAEHVAALPPSKGAKAYFVQHFEVHEGQPVSRVRATWTLPLHKIAVCGWLVDLAREEFGDPNVSLVPNSVDLDRFNAPPRTRQERPTVGFMYAGTPFKGCDLIIEAINLARRRLPDLQVVAFGSDPVAPHLPLPHDTRYEVRPNQDRIPELYASCDAWLFGSRSEGFGLPILEAMACRTPVIATPAGAAPDLINAGNGRLIPTRDPVQFSDTIVDFLSMPNDAWERHANAARETASSYTWSDATDRFEEALRTAVARDRGDETLAA